MESAELQMERKSDYEALILKQWSKKKKKNIYEENEP